MRAGELEDFIEQLKNLPTLPPVAVRILEVASDENSGRREISRLVETDQSLTAKILRIANSAYLGISREVSTVDKATALLGLDFIRSMALSILVVNTFEGDENEGFKMTEFWHHSFACAIAAELLAERLKYPRPEEAFVAGLLHDLGKLVLFRWDPDLYARVVSTAKDTHSSLLQQEESQLGVGHTKVAKIVMENWKFPESLVSTAWLHHQPVTELGSELAARLPLIIKSANSLCHVRRFGHSGTGVGDLTLKQIARVTQLSDAELYELSMDVFKRFEEVSHCFDWENTSPALFLSAVSRANEELGELQAKLMKKNRELADRERLLQAITELYNAQLSRPTAAKMVERIMEKVESLADFKRVLGFTAANHRVLEIRWKGHGDEKLQKVRIPLAEGVRSGDVDLTKVNQMQLFHTALKTTDAGKELSDWLESSNLLELPLEAKGLCWGQILIEGNESEPISQTQAELLKQFSGLAAAAVERSHLIDSLDQQSELLVKTARKVEQVQSRLYQAERLASVGRLAAGAAHEINNPLTTITAHAHLLLRSVEGEKPRKSLETIKDQAARISKIIGDLMGVARPAKPQVEPTDVRATIEHTLGTLEHRFRVAGLELKTNLQEGLPLITADSKQLEQVFLNLSLNAIQAMAKGGVLTVEASLTADGERVRVAFQDTGRGIPPDKIPMVFEPFYTTKEEGEGSGLGLAISHSIVEAHGGQMEVSSQPGEGTTFLLFFPVGQQLSTDFDGFAEAAKEDIVEVEEEADLATVLVIDDEEALRSVLSEALELEGYKVDLASDGEEGVRYLEKNEYDVVLLDLRMPKKQGLPVLEIVKKEYPSLPVIVISGLARDNEFDQAREAGAFACVKKPFDMNELLATVKSALDH
jgi:signal transduction histidine kinase/HD-like signal output (HDOD) protein